MKILFAINDLSFGGGQRTAVEEANGLFGCGYEVLILTLLDKPPEPVFLSALEIPRDNIVNIPFKSFADCGAFKNLVHFLRQAKPDLIFSNLFFTNTMIRLAKIFVWKPKIIIREGNVPEEKDFFVRITDSLLVFLTCKIIVNSEVIKKEFAKKLLIPQSKIKVIYNGIGEEFLTTKRYHAVSSPVSLITVGSLTKKKGHTYLIGALAEIKRRKPDLVFRLFIVGDGFLRLQLAKRVKELGLVTAVEFLGERPNVKELLARADIFVLSSLWEGMPNAMLEAMAVGLPVIATAVGGVPEIIRDGENGVLVPPQRAEMLGGAILGLIENPGLRKRLGIAARSTAADFTWPKHIVELKKIIKLCAG